MWFSSWLRNRAVPRKQRPTSRFRPTLEALETRAVPATLVVNTTLDVLGHDNGVLSLRQAIIDTNALPGADTIVVPAGAYTLTRAGATEDGGLTGDLEIKDSLTISGAGAKLTVIDGGGLDRVFQIDSGTVALSGMTIRRGADAGIYNAGTLTVQDAVVSGNQGSGIVNNQGQIYTQNPTLTLINTTVSGNHAGYAGGGLLNYNYATVRNCTFSGNSSTYGGGIYNEGRMYVSSSTFSNNTGIDGGGISNRGSLTVGLSTFSGNTAQYGGGIYNDGTGSLSMYRSTLTGNSAGNSGGAIWNNGSMDVGLSTLSGNTAQDGGGIYNRYGRVNVYNASTFSGNSAKYGGGIYNLGSSFSSVSVSTSTFAGNTASSAGGGIFNAKTGYVTIYRSKLTGDFAPVGADLYNLGTLSIDPNSTIGVIGP